MKRLALPLILLLFGVVSHLAAQTTYTVVPGSSAKIGTITFQGAGFQLSGTGNHSTGLDGYQPGHEWACGGESSTPSGTGTIFLTLGGIAQPCLDAASYTPIGKFGSGPCASEPASAAWVFVNGWTLTLYVGKYTVARGICYGTISGGSLITN